MLYRLNMSKCYFYSILIKVLLVSLFCQYSFTLSHLSLANSNVSSYINKHSFDSGQHQKETTSVTDAQNADLYPKNSSSKVATKNLNCLFSLFLLFTISDPICYEHTWNKYMGLIHHCSNIHLIFYLKKCILYMFKLYIRYILENTPYNRFIKSVVNLL